MSTSPHVRWMIRRDMPEVLEIESLCFGVHAWSEDDFVRQLRQRNCIGMILEENDIVRGFIIYELQRTYFRLLNLAVHPDHRECGVGRMMVEKQIGKLSSQRRTRLVVEVRESNVDAQLFFKAMGFRAVDILRDFYEDTEEDAYTFQYDVVLQGAPATA